MTEAVQDTTALDFNRDAELLTELLRNGRVSLNKLATRLDEYRQKLWRRQKELEGDVIWGYGAVVDEQKLGWRKYLLSMQLTGQGAGQESMEELRNGLADWPSLRTVGSYVVDGDDHNYVMEVICRTPFDLDRFVGLLGQTLGAGLQDTPRIAEVVFTVRQGGFVNPDVDRMERMMRSLYAIQTPGGPDDGL